MKEQVYAFEGQSATGISGVTTSAAELNILHGATITTEQLNYLDGVTNNVQEQLEGIQTKLDGIETDVTNTTYSVGDGGLTENNFTDALKTKLEGAVMNTDDEIISGKKEFSSTITGNLIGDVTGALILSNGTTIQGNTITEKIVPLTWIQLGGDIDGEVRGD